MGSSYRHGEDTDPAISTKSCSTARSRRNSMPRWVWERWGWMHWIPWCLLKEWCGGRWTVIWFLPRCPPTGARNWFKWGGKDVRVKGCRFNKRTIRINKRFLRVAGPGESPTVIIGTHSSLTAKTYFKHEYTSFPSQMMANKFTKNDVNTMDDW